MTMSVTQSTTDLYTEYVIPTYGRYPLEIERGEGCRVWDPSGQDYLDMGAGIAVCSIGHAHPVVADAVSLQARKLVHTSNLYYTRPQAELAERLTSLLRIPGKSFFCNSGAEANEGLYKTARKFGSTTGRFEIITFKNSFHGRTLGGISATAQEKVKVGFAPLVPGFVHLDFNDLAAVREAINERTVAILVEPIQGEGGIHPATPEFLQGLRALCDQHNLLLLFDEVQCGLGRTGDWGGWMSLVGNTVIPDGVSWAKGIANGFPLGAFWLRKKETEQGLLCDLLSPGSHGTTYGGNPLACAAALATLAVIEEQNLLAHAVEQGAYFREELREISTNLRQEVRAIGLMLGFALSPDFKSRLPQFADDKRTPSLIVTTDLLQAGLLAIPAGEAVLRFLPPLNVTRAEIDEAVQKLALVLARYESA